MKIRPALFLAPVALMAMLGSSLADERGDWITAVVGKIHARLHKPASHDFPASPTTVRIAFAVNGAGRILRARVAQSCGSPLLDRKALRAVRAASPLPRITWADTHEPLSFALPFEFHP